MSGLFTSIRKNNNRFTNLTKDANRASNSMRSFGKSLNFISVVGVIYTLRRLGSAMSSVVGSAMDMVETQNLFEVSMGDGLVTATAYVEKLSQLTGLDTTNLKSAVGNYALLAKSMGLSTDQATQLSTTITDLALDLSSLTNVPINQVMADLRSGLVGQSETVYKYGLDVTEAALKSEALALGISKSVRNMSQGEKMALRYNVMIRQSALAHGDFAKTLETPANQARILQERIVSLGRAIGTIFIPILTKVLPYLNAFVRVLTEIVQKIASLVGYEIESSNISDLSSNLDGVTDSAEEAASAMKGITTGIDELNLLTEPSVSTDDDTSSAGGILDGLELATYDNLLDSISAKSSEIAENIRTKLAEAYEYVNSKIQAILPTLETLGTNSLDIGTKLLPLGQEIALQSISSALEIFEALADVVVGLDFNPMVDGMVELAGAFGSLALTTLDVWLDLITKVLDPLAKWTVEESVPKVLEILSDTFTKISKINFTPITSALGSMVPTLKEFGNMSLDILGWLLDEFLLPVSGWAIETIFPSLITIITTAFQAFLDVLKLFKPLASWLWDELLVPLASWTGTEVGKQFDIMADTISGLGEAFGLFVDLVSGSPEEVAEANRQLIVKFTELKTRLTSAFETFVLKAYGKFGAFKLKISNILGDIVETFKENIDKVKGFWDDLKAKIQAAIDKLKEFFNMDNSDASVEFTTKYNTTSAPVYEYGRGASQYATGGMTSRGELFEAGEFGKAELIGNHKGSTTVMPLENSGFVEAMYSAVFNAVSKGSSGSNTPNNIEVSIGGEKFASAVIKTVNQQTTRYGGSRLTI